MKLRLSHFWKTAAVAVALLTGIAVPFGIGAATYDTSFAVEYSYSCLTGGCHETNAKLMSDYAATPMSHVMVKCNACHGTHTAAEVGLPKPNLTGYTAASSGATGYVVGKDRCKACHEAVLSNRGHPNNPGECLSCHAPHIFSR